MDRPIPVKMEPAQPMSWNFSLNSTAVPLARRTVLPVMVLMLASEVPAPAQAEQPLLALAQAQAQPPAAAVEDQSREAIDADIVTRIIALERERLDRLTRLAAKQPPAEAFTTYEELFRLAIANNLYRFAEPAAESLLKRKDLPKNIQLLANVVNIIGEADRGAYEDSFASLKAMVQANAARLRDGGGEVPVTTVLSVVEAYYQRLMRANQQAVARKALELLTTESRLQEVRDHASYRLSRLRLVGKPAPPIVGADLDEKALDLSAYKGRVVLLIFWATWHAPDIDTIHRAEELLETYQAQGLSIVGVNVDSMDEKAGDERTVRESVKKYLLQYNINWPNVLAKRGPGNAAEVYHVQEVPVAILIGRDGRVIHPDLFPETAREVILEALKAPSK